MIQSMMRKQDILIHYIIIAYTVVASAGMDVLLLFILNLLSGLMFFNSGNVTLW